MPYHKRINDWIHAHTAWSTFKHSCGAIGRFLDPFIEAGFDILNPVQWTAAGMDRVTVKARCDTRAVLWGGAVDTQRTLPFGTPEEVRREALESCRILGRHGGFVCNPIHNVQAKVPVENVIALVDAVHEYNRG